MTAVHRRIDRRPVRSARSPRIGVLALLGAVVWSVGIGVPPAVAQVAPTGRNPPLQAHKAKALKTLPSRPAGAVTPSGTAKQDFVSPYARAAAQRAASGVAPPGHARVSPQVSAAPARKPAQ